MPVNVMSPPPKFIVLPYVSEAFLNVMLLNVYPAPVNVRPPPVTSKVRVEVFAV